ncbi:MAG: DUF2169 domain-containing protein [Deltaproteobacteria bacterium]|nr:DUF2169 domain-containing protein [Deltaproteobacteria bacterium]
MPIGEVVTGSLLWRSHGRLHLTVILKATYGLKPGGAMRPVAPAPLNQHAVHYERQPTRSVMLPSDDVPYLAKTDVLFSGSVFSPAKLPIPFTKVRLAVHGDESLVEKTLHVHGDRVVGPGGPSAPQPFTELPLVYERARRDPEGADNPVGIDPASAGLLPNIEDPSDPDRVAGFGPISRYWRSRRNRISSLSRELLGREVMEIASGFDWAYFQAAPPDQQCRHLSGDEWVVVEGMDPKICAVHSRLPGGTAVACVWPASRHGTLSLPVQMNADTLFIDGDARTCTMTWRGSFPIAGQEVLDAVHIAAGVHTAAEPIDWPAARAAARARRRLHSAAEVRVDEQGTLTLGDTGQQAVPVAADVDEAVSLVLSSSDLIEVPESLPESAVSLDPDDLEEFIEEPAVPEPPSPPSGAADALAGAHSGVHIAAQGAPEVEAGEADDLLAQTTVSSTGAQDPLLQTVAIAPGDEAALAPPVAAAPVAAAPLVTPEIAEPPAPQPAPAEPPSAAAPAGEPPTAEPPAVSDPLLQTIGLADVAVGPAATPWDPQPPAATTTVGSRDSQPPAPVPVAPPGEDGPLNQTLGLDDVQRPAGLRGTLDAVGEPPSMGAPFAVAPGSEQPVVLRPAAFPGAPWSDEPVQPVLPPTGDPLAETYRLDPALAAAAKAVPRADGTSTAPPSSVAPGAQRSDPAAAKRAQLLERIRLGQGVADLDLSAADLSGLDLTGAGLSGARLAGANLRQACLARADLSHAQLAGADLSGARLDGAKLDDANLHGAVLRGASLGGVTLHRADLGEADGGGASFERAAGYEASFARGSWADARFFDAQIDQADFSQAVLDRANLDSVVLRQARLDDVRAIDLSAAGANLIEVSARRAVLLNGNFTRIAGERSRWHDSVLDDSSFAGADLEGASLAGASCQRADFSNSNLRGAQLHGARLDHTSFREARLSRASLVGLDLSTADLTGADQDD